MKRSEMIKIIEFYLKSYYNVGPIDIHEPEDLLNIIEKAGMLPPKTIIPTKYQFLPVNEWEPEDET